MRPKLTFLSAAFLVLFFGKVGCIGHFTSLSWWGVAFPILLDLILHVFAILDKERMYIARLVVWLKEREIKKARNKYFNTKK